MGLALTFRVACFLAGVFFDATFFSGVFFRDVFFRDGFAAAATFFFVFFPDALRLGACLAFLEADLVGALLGLLAAVFFFFLEVAEERVGFVFAGFLRDFAAGEDLAAERCVRFAAFFAVDAFFLLDALAAGIASLLKDPGKSAIIHALRVSGSVSSA